MNSLFCFPYYTVFTSVRKVFHFYLFNFLPHCTAGEWASSCTRFRSRPGLTHKSLKYQHSLHIHGCGYHAHLIRILQALSASQSHCFRPWVFPNASLILASKSSLTSATPLHVYIHTENCSSLRKLKPVAGHRPTGLVTHSHFSSARPFYCTHPQPPSCCHLDLSAHAHNTFYRKTVKNRPPLPAAPPYSSFLFSTTVSSQTTNLSLTFHHTGPSLASSIFECGISDTIS